ncbi:TPA: phage integrase N-terminal domain-containing protein [Salmonella enterica subsp. enterica serovar Enteritidis]
MNKLNYELKNLCKRNHDGAFVTQKNRHNCLQLMADQLQAVGFHTRVMSVHDLKGRHVNRLVSLWKQQALTPAPSVLNHHGQKKDFHGRSRF